MLNKKVMSVIVIGFFITLPFLTFIVPVQATTYDVYVKWDAWNLIGANQCGDGNGKDCEWNIQIDYCDDQDWIKGIYLDVDLDASDYSISYSKDYEDVCSFVQLTLGEYDLFGGWDAISSTHTVSTSTNNYKIDQNTDVGYVYVDVTINTT